MEIKKQGSNFRVGVHRRIYNANLKDAIVVSGMTFEELSVIVFFSKQAISDIVNFRRYPTDHQKTALSVALDASEEILFPQNYDKLYEKLSIAQRDATMSVKMMELSSQEVLSLPAPTDLEAQTELMFLKDVFKSILEDLTDREQSILSMRFGLEDGIYHTLEEVGRLHGVTRERIRYIEAKALEKIKEHPLARNLEHYVLN